MANRRKKPKTLNEAEAAAIVAAATALHRAVCRPLIDPQGAHYRACVDLNAAIVVALRAITGADPSWMTSYTATSQAALKGGEPAG